MKIQIIRAASDSLSAYEFLQKYKGGLKVAISFKVGKKRKLKKFRVHYTFEARDEWEMNELCLVRGDGTEKKKYFYDLINYSDVIE